VRKLILLFENKERTDEMLNEIEKEVTELEEKLGYSKLTEDLRKRIMDTREGK
jgi:Mg2+ and Co2+ transporter CorA